MACSELPLRSPIAATAVSIITEYVGCAGGTVGALGALGTLAVGVGVVVVAMVNNGG